MFTLTKKSHCSKAIRKVWPDHNSRKESTSAVDIRSRHQGPDMVHMPIIPVLGRQRQEDHEFKASLGLQ
jgi:hypothetical protein